VAKVVVAHCLATYKKCEQVSVRMVNSGSIPLRTTNQSKLNMSKIKDNHLAEIIIALIIATTLLTSCVEQAESSENMPSQEEYYSNNCENCDEID
jgi:hypothetical protein